VPNGAQSCAKIGKLLDYRDFLRYCVQAFPQKDCKVIRGWHAQRRIIFYADSFSARLALQAI
jgi:hypothetical protein